MAVNFNSLADAAGSNDSLENGLVSRQRQSLCRSRRPQSIASAPIDVQKELEARALELGELGCPILQGVVVSELVNWLSARKICRRGRVQFNP